MDEWVVRGTQPYDFLDLRGGSADRLPWPAEPFDLVHQAMLFSSVPDPSLRGSIAAETRRVVRPVGWVMWYDFFFNPINPGTAGMTLARVRALFPGWRITDRSRVTLATPLSRLIRPVRGGVVNLLSRLRILNSHHLLLPEKPV